MKGSLANEYSKLCKDNVRRQFYVYQISGTQEEIEQFENSDEVKTTDDNGNPLWITSRDYVGNYVTLVWRKDGKLAIDTSEIRKMASLARQFGEAGNAIIMDYITKQTKKNTTTNTVSNQKASSDLDLSNL